MASTTRESKPSYRKYGFGAAPSVNSTYSRPQNGVQEHASTSRGGFTASAGSDRNEKTANSLHHRGNRPVESSSNGSSGGSQAYMKLKLSQLQRQLANVDFALNEVAEGNGDCSNQRKSEISQEINALLRDIDELQRSFQEAYGNAAEESRRTLVPMKTRIDQLKQGAQTARRNLQKLMSNQYSSKRLEKEREELFRGAGSATGSQYIAINEYSKEQQSLERSHQMIDEYTNIAATIGSRLREQRATLKGAQRRVLDMINSLSVGRSLIRAIERRSAGDKAIVYSGMIVTALVMYLAWRYVRAES
eukprot:gb/GECG01011310.1/.p1 GENE.gb/GECG01011310.1/~~gb/GECG01011310.1/.p1  ORF type:complete len:305 (+),score=44.02 gb/GECG01011310.1/:1-915(+)